MENVVSLDNIDSKERFFRRSVRDYSNDYGLMISVSYGGEVNYEL